MCVLKNRIKRFTHHEMPTWIHPHNLETITGINQKQLAHYASGISKPRPKQAEKISQGLHKLAKEMMAVTV
jgi:hypothetical protein